MKTWRLLGAAVFLAAGASPALAQYDDPAADPATDPVGEPASDPNAYPPAAEPVGEPAGGDTAGGDTGGGYDYPPPPPPTPNPPPTVDEPEIEEEEGSSWWENFTVNGFVDSFYHADWNRPDDPSATSTVGHRAFESHHGFGLAFAGLDIGYSGEHVGARLDLRYGQGQSRLINGAPTPTVLQMVKQAYLSWNITDKIALDFGQFDTLYGAEVADSWRNINYTRGALYYLMQPFYHQGLRLGVEVSDSFSLTGMVVNGTNNVVDNNYSPHFGLQAGLSFGDASLALGYYTGAGSSGFGGSDPTSNDDWEHFFDVVFGLEAGSLTLIANFDMYISGPDSGEGPSIYWGASVAAGLALSEMFGIGIRGEFLHDPDAYIGDGQEILTTGTLTLDLKPVDNLIIRLDNRFEFADEDIFPAADGPQGVSFATTLGLVVTSDP